MLSASAEQQRQEPEPKRDVDGGRTRVEPWSFPGDAGGRRTVDPLTQTRNFSLKLRILMFIPSHFKLQGVLSEANFMGKPMEPLAAPQSFV